MNYLDIQQTRNWLQRSILQTDSPVNAVTLLMIEPSFFDVTYVINPHMQQHIGQIDQARARAQWNTLRSCYISLGARVETLPGVLGLPDLVFCANQSLVQAAPSSPKRVWMSRMMAGVRQKEVPILEAWFCDQGFQIDRFSSDQVEKFEGGGDAIWHPTLSLLWGGFGFRSSFAAYEEISAVWNVAIAPLELNDPDFYHLDTCFCVLDSTRVLICPAAFSRAGLELIRAVWPTVLEAPENEARLHFACNAHCMDGHHVLLPTHCPATAALLSREGFTVLELDTSEFLKSGGSIYCMKAIIG